MSNNTSVDLELNSPAVLLYVDKPPPQNYISLKKKQILRAKSNTLKENQTSNVVISAFKTSETSIKIKKITL